MTEGSIDWKKCASQLHDEVTVLKADAEDHDGICQGLRSKIAAKDKKLEALVAAEQRLKASHAKQIAKLYKKHNDETTQLHTHIHQLEESVLLLQGADEANKGKDAYYEARIETLRHLNKCIMGKVEALSNEKEALLLIIANSEGGLKKMAEKVCHLSERERNGQFPVSRAPPGMK
jgi:chromosome segregation ATPase